MRYTLCRVWLWLNRKYEVLVYGIAMLATGLVITLTLGMVKPEWEMRAVRWILFTRDWLLEYDCGGRK